MARVLVVDDDPLVLAAIMEVLESGGHEAVPAGPAADHAAIALSERYDLLLTDIFLPTVSGWDLIKAVRQKRPMLPVVAISGGGVGVGKDLTLKISEVVGADVVLPKPVDAGVLLLAIDTALKRRKPN